MVGAFRPRGEDGERGDEVHGDTIPLHVFVFHVGVPHNPFAVDVPEHGGPVQVVHPARQWILEGTNHDSWPNDDDGKVQGGFVYDVLRQRLSERVCVGLEAHKPAIRPGFTTFTVKGVVEPYQ